MAQALSRNLDIDWPECYRILGGFGEIMRRLEAFFPILLFAILVQLFAPIAAFRAVALASSDPLYMASVCAEISANGGDQSAPAQGPHAHGDCCAFCGLGHGGDLAIDPPALVLVSLERSYRSVTWLVAMDLTPPVRVGSNAQARAPPLAA